jgi:hypothetical protein
MGLCICKCTCICKFIGPILVRCRLRTSLLFVAVALLTACARNEPKRASAEEVTVAQVLASPRQFNGKRISLVGYYVVANEESCLFRTQRAAKREEAEQCIWIDFPDKSDLTSIADRMSRIVGTFRYIPGRRRHEKGTEEWSLVWPYLLEDVLSFHPVR